MPKRPWLVESDKPSYQVLKWVGGGGFGQVFKVLRNGQTVACKQVQVDNAEAALDEYDHMRSLRGAPHIATLHDGLEFNRKTGTLSFFMDYYRGKDLDRQVQMLRGAAERFTEGQIVEIGYQIAVALEFCHSRNILHQDIKPMNAQRGTPGYEAPEIRGQGYQAAFSQKSDVYAFGCILYRLCTLEDPAILDDIKPSDISLDYSIELLSLTSSMLSVDRDDRPTASQVREQLATLGLQLFPAPALHCKSCHQSFPSKNQLSKHYKDTKNQCRYAAEHKIGPNHALASDDTGLKIRGAAEAPAQHYYDENATDVVDPSPCIVCMRHFNSKKRFYKHLHGVNHYRKPNYVYKRRAEQDLDIDGERAEKRVNKWIAKDMFRHD
ncbi:Nn.00g001040.m01.CDS01 [Neocucurbitaria sp. VM-36]